MHELAAEFGCHRTTVAGRLKKAEIATRGQSPTSETIDSMVRLYASGFSFLKVGKQLGFCANTVRNHLLRAKVKTRNRHESHTRDRLIVKIFEAAYNELLNEE